MGPCGGSREGLGRVELGPLRFLLQSSGAPGVLCLQAERTAGFYPGAKPAHRWHTQGWPLEHTGTNFDRGAMGRGAEPALGGGWGETAAPFLFSQLKRPQGLRSQAKAHSSCVRLCWWDGSGCVLPAQYMPNCPAPPHGHPPGEPERRGEAPETLTPQLTHSHRLPQLTRGRRLPPPHPHPQRWAGPSSRRPAS